MRLWSIHPSYLDSKGLVALWREGLLAKKVLEGATNGYRNHPQLIRFRNSPDPIKSINSYLEGVAKEAKKRGYTFDTTKIAVSSKIGKISVTHGQLEYEREHLQTKLDQRDTVKAEILRTVPTIKAHPLFRVTNGDIEVWEKRSMHAQQFPYEIDFTKTDFRKHPELYRVGIGEQGVLLVEPFKSEILPFWRFRTPVIATASAKKIYALFLSYKKVGDFIGMDMARKFLQMGYTRSRRYANHASGRKYELNPQTEVHYIDEKIARTKQRPQAADWKTNEKAQSAHIFYGYYLKAKNDKTYINHLKKWKAQYR